MSRPRCVVLVGDRGEPFDGVLDHALLLAEALREHSTAHVLVRDLQGRWRTEDGALQEWGRVRATVEECDAVVLSYAPWNLGLGWKHWRFVLELPKLASAARHARRVLFLHELATTATGLEATLDRIAQERQFRWVSRTFPTVAGATFLVPPRLSRRRTMLPLAVGSLLPDMRHQREAVRRELGLERSLVVASFVQAYRSPVRHLVSAGLEGCRDASSAPVTHLVLGSSADPHPVTGVDEHRAGAVSQERLASLLSCADLLLAPYADGASARRSTLAAALQHGVPTITNASAVTASWLMSSRGVILAQPEPPSFASEASTLAKDEVRRREAAVAARELYEQRLTWSAVVDALYPALMTQTGS